MHKNGKQWIGSIFGLVCIVSLNGCSLAVPEAEAKGGEDRLIGAFITAEYLDLYDMEGYLKDHGNLLTGGGEVALPRDPEYDGRLYAQIDQSKGPYDWEISFGGVSGEYMLYAWQPGEDGSHRMCLCTDGICDIDTNTNIMDDGAEYGISGTMYLLPGQADEEATYYANPVYQTAEGEIYAVSGQGFLNGGDSPEGAVFSTTLSGEIVHTENGNTKTETNSVAVHYAVMDRPLRITLCQMSQDHQVVKQDVYRPGELPENIVAEPGTAYILAETEKEKTSGEKTVSRAITGYDPDKESFLETFYALDQGIVAKIETEVDWGR